MRVTYCMTLARTGVEGSHAIDWVLTEAADRVISRIHLTTALREKAMLSSSHCTDEVTEPPVCVFKVTRV